MTKEDKEGFTTVALGVLTIYQTILKETQNTALAKELTGVWIKNMFASQQQESAAMLLKWD